MNTRITALVPARRAILIRNSRGKFHVSVAAFGSRADLVKPMDDAEKYRQYAAECRRLAGKSPAKDGAILLEIADAWVACAEKAEQMSQSRKPPSRQ